MIALNTTVRELFDLIDEFNAGSMKVVIHNRDGQPCRALIVLRGVEETESVIQLIEGVEESWREDGTEEISEPS